MILVTGLRSAQFGMSEAQVKEAITQDFKIPSRDLVKGENEVQRTTNFQIMVDQLVPASGKSRISYIFGYTSQRLVQITAQWTADDDNDASVQALIDTATLLRKHFLEKTWQPKSVVLNGEHADGSVTFFQGTDREDHVVHLLLVGTKKHFTSPNGESRTVFRPTGLLLSYVKDARKPDIFQ